MHCPYCKSSDIQVIDVTDYKDLVVRRRKCKKCRAAFFTQEYIDPDGKLVRHALYLKTQGVLINGEIEDMQDV